MQTRDLDLYPWPNPSLPALKALKAELGLDFMVAPKAAVAGCERVLSTTTVPPFACDYALVRGDSTEDLRWAMLWALGVTEDERANTVADWLSIHLKAEVKEVK